MSAYVPDALEREVLALWERERTFATSDARRAGAPPFAFYDGPPYATGSPHYGHLLQTAIKDAVTRYWTMRGFFVRRRVGWDCHGLPIENLVERELGITRKKEIEERGIEAFNAACRAVVLRHVDEFTSLLRRFGRWADYANAYVTMDASFMESAWWVFQHAWKRGLVYQGVRSSPYCPRCETPLSHFETTLGYTDVTDPAITVKIPLADDPRTFLLVWTTTPWTLPGNAAVAVHPDAQYVRVPVDGETWIVAKDRVGAVVPQAPAGSAAVKGRDLIGRSYIPLYAFVAPEKPAHRVVAAPFVSLTEGTGLVHIAPAFGEEDFRLAEELSLPLVRTVDERGRFVAAVTPWAGLPVKDADRAIITDLERRNLLARRDEIVHAYPHCWRCATPLIYLATDSWFIAVTKMKEQLQQTAAEVRWVPGHLKEGRFGQGLRDAPDWAVSRTRYWGIPLPVWECRACKEYLVLGSIEELRERGGDLSLLRSPHANPDLHRPYVDRIVLRCERCGGEARRVPEVLDVWFDSGSMPYGQWHYPFENRELVERTFPADFVAEALEQTRGWFYTLHVLAGILTIEDVGLGTSRPAFRNAVASGLILAEDGRKLSKSLQNFPDPGGLVAAFGADTLRLYLLSATKLGEDTRFSDRLVGELYRRFTLILWNVWQFYRTHSAEGAHGTTPGAPRTLLDRWIRARTGKLVQDVRAAMDAYHPDDGARALLPFVDDLSTWYVRRSRGRPEALSVLGEVLTQFSRVVAPFIPFLAEHLHRELAGTSPHLADYPSAELSENDAELLRDMDLVRAWAAVLHRERKEKGYKLRQPLSTVTSVGVPEKFRQAEWQQLLADETNVKHFEFLETAPAGITLRQVRDGMSTTISEAVTKELEEEGIVRDLLRHVQDLRKQAGYAFGDSIVLSVVTDDAAVQAAIDRFRGLLREKTKSREVRLTRGKADAAAEVTVGAARVWLGVASAGG